ncbi:MAG: UDP-N-acetylmuramate dehydrogenase [Liquorilactobacillus sp.]|uniref:UDP-N-acetylmuramate dehydrogenase n=1 Tax=Liquorilactobacillus sp. TaxID=2767923 RepID=UPI0039EA519C
MKQIQELFVEKFTEEKIKVERSLSEYTNTKTGGPAEILAFPTETKDICEMINIANEYQLRVTVIGNASNLIVREKGIRGLVIILTNMKSIKIENSTVIAEAGASLIGVTERVYSAGLTGMEFAAGIPGSVGGAVFMNAGAYEGDVSQVVSEVEVLTPEGKMRTYTNEEMNFAYRHSRIQDEEDIVLKAVFRLQSGDKKEIREKMDNFNFLRGSKQPLEYPSCGSVFKRPKGYFTGKLIHDAGLQGFMIGGAQISLKHAGFIVNRGNATASDYIAVIKYIKTIIKQEFSVELQTEVRIIGEK